MKILESEKRITDLLQRALRGEIYVDSERTSTCSEIIGYGLSYYLTEILELENDSSIRGKWIDEVSWENFILIPPNKLKASGKLWWAFDEAVSFSSEDFYCELELNESGQKMTITYLFQFQMDGKSYNLQN